MTSAETADFGEADRESEAIPMVRRKRDSFEPAPDSTPWSRPSGELAGVPRPMGVRRIIIRFIGLVGVAACIWGAVHIAREPKAREEIAAWGTLGNPRIASTAARGVRSVVDTVRSFGK
jgi:hypothetical protein